MRIPPKEPSTRSENETRHDVSQEEKHLLHAILSTNTKKRKDDSGGEPRDASFTATADLLLARIKDMIEMRLQAESEDRDARTKSEELTGDWMAAALVLDRFFLIITAGFLIIGSAILFCLVLGSYWLL